jgi:hypothetical protein
MSQSGKKIFAALRLMHRWIETHGLSGLLLNPEVRNLSLLSEEGWPRPQ